MLFLTALETADEEISNRATGIDPLKDHRRSITEHIF